MKPDNRLIMPVVACACALLSNAPTSLGADAPSSATPPGGYAGFVDPFIGTGSTGHCFPAACVPFGLVQAGPDTGCWGWKYCGGYQYRDKTIMGFSQTHLNGTGVPDLGDVLIMPGDSLEPQEYDKAGETAAPGHYAVAFKNGIRCEVTSTERVGFYRFTFPEGMKPGFVIDARHGMDNSGDGRGRKHRVAELAPDGKSGKVHSVGWVARDLYFATDERRAGDRTLFVKVGISPSSVEAARRNIAGEIPGWDFDAVRSAARAKWEAILSRIEIEGDAAAKTNAYTAIYHLCVQPNDLTDFGEKPYYTTLSTWDTYRAAHPLYTLVTPERVPGFIDSMIDHFRKFGKLPRWTLWGKENWCMIGDHAIPAVADAFLKGFPIDAEAAYDAVRVSLTTNLPTLNVLNPRYELYDQYGYQPFDIVNREAVSRQMEDCYDFYCAAKMAEKLGKKEDAEFFFRRAGSWTNVFDRTTNMVRGRDTKGAWRDPFDPNEMGRNAGKEGNDYTEGTAWQWTWHVLHDPAGLIAAFGGREKFLSELERFFAEGGTPKVNELNLNGKIGWYGHWNEPSHHIAYLFSLAGRPDRTAEIVRYICTVQYRATPEGLCGNEDCGQMSAWYFYSILGFYPVDAVGGEYVVGAPQVPRAAIRLPGGKTFTMVAKNLSKENKYVKSVTMNGKPLEGWTIKHADVVAGGELVFEMCPFRDSLQR